MHSPETVKRDLPDVKLRLPSGRETTGAVRGRKCEFATVFYLGGDGEDCTVAYAWSQIANALNANRALRV